MENKQTAVEWLENKLSKLYDTQFKTFEEFRSKEAILWQQAKAIEKEQIKNAYSQGLFGEEATDSISAYAEQYYNETYNKQDNEN